MSTLENNQKLETLAEVEGTSVERVVGDGCVDEVAAGICVNPCCDYTTEVEPDQDAGWCERCQTNTVKSAPVLAGFL